MAYHKTLKEGESIAISGACVITATNRADIQIDAKDSVEFTAPNALKWENGGLSGLPQASGDSGQAYIIYKNGASMYDYEDGRLTEYRIYEGDRPKQFCETHNLKMAGKQ